MRLTAIRLSDLFKSAHISRISKALRCLWDDAMAMALTILGRLTTHGQSGHRFDVVLKGPYAVRAAAA